VIEQACETMRFEGFEEYLDFCSKFREWDTLGRSPRPRLPLDPNCDFSCGPAFSTLHVPVHVFLNLCSKSRYTVLFMDMIENVGKARHGNGIWYQQKLNILINNGKSNLCLGPLSY